VSGRVLLGGLRLRPGSLRLIGLRVLLQVLCFAPAYAAAVLGITESHGYRPELAEHPGPLPVSEVSRLFRDLPSTFWLLSGLGIVAVVLLDQLLTAGGLALLDPTRSQDEPVRVGATIWRQGKQHFWRFVRVVLLVAVLFGLGAMLLGWLFDTWSEHGARVGYSGLTEVVVLPGLRLLAATLWLAVVGALACWARLLTVADDRQRVRRTTVHVLRLFWRRPGRSLVFFVVLSVAVQVLGGAVLVRSAPPVRGSEALERVVAWALYLIIHGYVWHWLLHAGQRLYARPELDRLRGASDEPWGLGRWLTSRWRPRRTRRP
jgi:hypothetical protein